MGINIIIFLFSFGMQYQSYSTRTAYGLELSISFGVQRFHTPCQVTFRLSFFPPIFCFASGWKACGARKSSVVPSNQKAMCMRTGPLTFSPKSSRTNLINRGKSQKPCHHVFISFQYCCCMTREYGVNGKYPNTE